MTFESSSKAVSKDNGCPECEKLKKDIARLKQELNDERERITNTPLVDIIFKNKNLSRKYEAKVDKFLQELLSGENYHSPDSENLEKNKKSCFYIDSEVHDKHSRSLRTPIYHQDYTDTLKDNKENSSEEKVETPSKHQAVTCFNCLGPHLLDQCPEKKDPQKIAHNRRQYMLTNNQMNQRTSRYHEDDQCKANMKPGIIGKELRLALDLYPDQLPLHIYRMRILGYPPGWLKEAEVEHSGIRLYDEEGNDVHDASCSEKFYDPNKLIDYPGFNTPIPSDFIDEWEELKMPQMRKDQLRSEVQKTMKTPEAKPYRKRKETVTPVNYEKERKVEDGMSRKNECSEEFGNQRCTCLIQTSNGQREPKTRKENGNLNIINSGYERLSSSSSDTSQDSVTPERIANKCPIHSHSSSLSNCPGTPVISTGNPFTRLPDPTKFAKDITEHIPYENLPDATGSFEKMRGILESVKYKQYSLQ